MTQCGKGMVSGTFSVYPEIRTLFTDDMGTGLLSRAPLKLKNYSEGRDIGPVPVSLFIFLKRKNDKLFSDASI